MAKLTTERLGAAPTDRSSLNRSNAAGSCPDIIKVEDASELGLEGMPGMRETVHLVIGTVVSREQLNLVDLPEGTSIAKYEAVVAIPDEVLRAAADMLLARQVETTA